MGVIEVSTLSALRAHMTELIDAKIAEHGGRIVKTRVDGILIEFTSIVDVTSCAEEVQREIAAHNAEIQEDKRVIFRIGATLGDVIIKATDVLDDGINR